jgi:hypothetical protein
MSESLEQGLRGLINLHLQRATPAQLLDLVEGMIDAERPIILPQCWRAASPAPAPVPAQGSRFTRLAADGTPMVCSKDEHVAVHDAETGLIWSADSLGEANWADAKKLTAGCQLMGKEDWRLPTVKELLSLIDYERYDPAVVPDFFRGSFGWTWSSTAAKHPSGYAWFVDLDGGYSGRGNVDSPGRVRAVRAGQSLGLTA